MLEGEASGTRHLGPVVLVSTPRCGLIFVFGGRRLE